MNSKYIEDIDWENIWKKQAGHILRTGKEAADFWDKRSESYEKSVSKSSYTDDLLSRMALKPEYSVLDVGGGTGLMAVPIAKKVNKVTVLDISDGMLKHLNDKTASMGITNISVINNNWYEMDVKAKIEPHDIVLASRFLPMGDKLLESLDNMNSAAKKRCYVTWRAQSFDNVEAESCRLLDKEYTPYPEYPVIYNCLYKMGIKANIEIFESASEQLFSDLEKAVKYFSKGEVTANNPANDNYKAFVKSQFTKNNDWYYRKSFTKWALIWWQVDK